MNQSFRLVYCSSVEYIIIRQVDKSLITIGSKYPNQILHASKWQLLNGGN